MSYKIIRQFISKDGQLEETESRTFERRGDFLYFLEEQFKYYGEYNLHDTNNWRSQAAVFEKNGYYCKFVDGSIDFVRYWDNQKDLILNDLIIDGFFVSGEYYMYLNFLQIYDKVKEKMSFPEVWDGHYHLTLYWRIAFLKGLFSTVVKKRQFGSTYLHLVKPIINLWFKRNTVNKLIAFDEGYINMNGCWKIVEEYRSFLNENTGWFRNFDPDSPNKLLLQQRIKVSTEGKAEHKGNKSILKGITTKQSPTSGVGGATNYAYIEESGVNPTLDKTKGYMESALKMGGILTSELRQSGSVGELKDCAPLQEMAFNPEKNGIMHVVDPETGDITCMFVPEWVNYSDVLEDEQGNIVDTVQCYDKDGNTNKEQALELIYKVREKKKKGSILNYNLYCSQHPLTLKEAFQTREENIFPVELINPHYLNIQSKEYIPVELSYNTEGKVEAKVSRSVPPVLKYPLGKNDDKRGCPIILEYPMKDAPRGLYYAGIDPIKSQKTETSPSLFAIYIHKAAHKLRDELIGDQQVAFYVGRYDDAKQTFEIARKLIHYYNATAAIENDQASFIEWMISKKEQACMLKRSDMPILKELVPNSQIGEEYGFKTGSGNRTIKNFLYDTIIDYCREEIGTIFDDTTGESKIIYGVTRIKDRGILEEMLKWSPNANCDRLIAFGAALMVANSRTNRGIMAVSTEAIQDQKVQPTHSLINNYKLGNTFSRYKTLKLR